MCFQQFAKGGLISLVNTTFNNLSRKQVASDEDQILIK